MIHRFILISLFISGFVHAQKPDTFLEKDENLKLSLKAHISAIEIDSAYLQLLTDKGLYKKMQSDVHSDSYIELEREVTEKVLRKRLAEIDKRTPINIGYNKNLASVINYYLSKDEAYFQRIFSLGDFYFPMIESALVKRSLPLELKYLAVVESALNPQAKSHAGAVGLWQFMYQTGKAYGLAVNSYQDERMQPELATAAAAEYLEDLYRIFDDWNLALAAYNSGPGNVNKAIRQSGGNTDFWDIKYFLPRETSGYVPSFLAILYLFEFADEHGIEYRKPPVFRYATDTVQIKRSLDMTKLAESLSVEKEMIEYLNPSYYKGVIPFYDHKKQYIRLPIRAAGSFVSNEDKIYNYAAVEKKKKEKKTRDQPIVYRVKRGDFLGKIANKFSVRVHEIKRWNGLRSSRLAIGQRLIIRKNDKGSIASDQREYIVQYGDSLWTIARKFPGVSVKDIKRANNLSNASIKPGMRLKIKS